MRLLLDNNLSPQLIGLLTGHDVEHVRVFGLGAAADEIVLARASVDGRVLVSADTDFGRLLAESRASVPSVILIRRPGDRRVADLANLLQANLFLIEDDLAAGALAVIGGEDIRIRSLPVLPGG